MKIHFSSNKKAPGQVPFVPLRRNSDPQQHISYSSNPLPLLSLKISSSRTIPGQKVPYQGNILLPLARLTFEQVAWFSSSPFSHWEQMQRINHAAVIVSASWEKKAPRIQNMGLFCRRHMAVTVICLPGPTTSPRQWRLLCDRWQIRSLQFLCRCAYIFHSVDPASALSCQKHTAGGRPWDRQAILPPLRPAPILLWS